MSGLAGKTLPAPQARPSGERPDIKPSACRRTGGRRDQIALVAACASNSSATAHRSASRCPHSTSRNSARRCPDSFSTSASTPG